MRVSRFTRGALCRWQTFLLNAPVRIICQTYVFKPAALCQCYKLSKLFTNLISPVEPSSYFNIKVPFKFVDKCHECIISVYGSEFIVSRSALADTWRQCTQRSMAMWQTSAIWWLLPPTLCWEVRCVWYRNSSQRPAPATRLSLHVHPWFRLYILLTSTLYNRHSRLFLEHCATVRSSGSMSANRGMSIAGFAGGALRDLSRFLQQCVRMFI